MHTWLLLDVSYLCHRAWHSTGALSHEGQSTGVAYGVLRDVEAMIQLHQPTITVFAFDGPGENIRRAISPGYKRRNDRLTEEERERRRELYSQIDALRTKILPESGYSNMISVRGYEGDDVIAAVAQIIPDKDEGVIVSCDGDLLQCLRENVVLYNIVRKKATTVTAFRQEWGIEPEQWPSVKAIAGCRGDDVVGVPGIGDKSAALWVRGLLKPGSKKHTAILDNLHVHNANLPLVKLPFPGLELPEIVADVYDAAKQMAVKQELGIRKSRTSNRAREKAKRYQEKREGFF